MVLHWSSVAPASGSSCLSCSRISCTSVQADIFLVRCLVFTLHRFDSDADKIQFHRELATSLEVLPESVRATAIGAWQRHVLAVGVVGIVSVDHSNNPRTRSDIRLHV